MTYAVRVTSIHPYETDGARVEFARDGGDPTIAPVVDGLQLTGRGPVLDEMRTFFPNDRCTVTLDPKLGDASDGPVVRVTQLRAEGEDGVTVQFAAVGGDPSKGVVVSSLSLIARGKALVGLSDLALHKQFVVLLEDR